MPRKNQAIREEIETQMNSHSAAQSRWREFPEINQTEYKDISECVFLMAQNFFKEEDEEALKLAFDALCLRYSAPQYKAKIATHFTFILLETIRKGLAHLGKIDFDGLQAFTTPIKKARRDNSSALSYVTPNETTALLSETMNVTEVLNIMRKAIDQQEVHTTRSPGTIKMTKILKWVVVICAGPAALGGAAAAADIPMSFGRESIALLFLSILLFTVGLLCFSAIFAMAGVYIDDLKFETAMQKTRSAGIAGLAFLNAISSAALARLSIIENPPFGMPKLGAIAVSWTAFTTNQTANTLLGLTQLTQMYYLILLWRLELRMATTCEAKLMFFIKKTGVILAGCILAFSYFMAAQEFLGDYLGVAGSIIGAIVSNTSDTSMAVTTLEKTWVFKSPLPPKDKAIRVFTSSIIAIVLGSYSRNAMKDLGRDPLTHVFIDYDYIDILLIAIIALTMVISVVVYAPCGNSLKRAAQALCGRKKAPLYSINHDDA